MKIEALRKLTVYLLILYVLNESHYLSMEAFEPIKSSLCFWSILHIF